MITRNEIEAIIEKLADKTLSFGQVIKVSSVGMWGHRASVFYFKVISEKNYDGGNCMDKVYLLENCGFQRNGEGWKPQSGYPETLEITAFWQRKEEELYKYELTKGAFHKDFKILGHQIMLGDILAKMKEKYSLSVGKMLLNFWEPCGLDKSLQQIFDDSGWEEGYIQDGKFFPSECTVEIERLKDPSAQSLGEYLLTIFKV